MTVMMPVTVIGECCKNCPDLEIEIQTMEIRNFQMESYINAMKCEHYERCLRIYGTIEKGVKEDAKHE